MSKEYIEREALIETLRYRHKPMIPTGSLIDSLYAWIERSVQEFPKSDVVEVVRCKDCRFCKKHPTSDKIKRCTNEQQWVELCYPLVYDNDFCSYGEREEV